MPGPQSSPLAARSSQLANVTCLACSCLCDDITVHISADRIVRADHACPIGRQWFTAAGRKLDAPTCLVDGKPAELEAGYDRVAQILNRAQHPLVFGLAGATCEAVGAAVAIADRIGGTIDPADDGPAALSAAVESVGIVTATLGEVRHRANLVIFWHVDPATTHPRHFERYSLTCAGRFIPGGRADRMCVVVDHTSTATTAAADVLLQIKPDGDAAAIAVLRSLMSGNDSNTEDVERQTGAPVSQWCDLANRMMAARYGAVFFDPQMLAGSQSADAIGDLLTIVRELNEHTRFVALPLGATGNATGAEQVLMWQTGYSRAVSFAGGFPQFDPDKSSAAAVLTKGRADAALVVNAAATVHLPDAARKQLAKIPTIALVAGDEDAAPTSAVVVFHVAVPGIHVGGTVFRSDGVPLPLRPALVSLHPSAATVLAHIAERVAHNREARA